MKKLLFIFLWLLNSNFSEKSEWYIELYTEDNVTVKVPRNEYLEYKEMLQGYDNVKFKESYHNAKLTEYFNWEFKEKYEKQKIIN